MRTIFLFLIFVPYLCLGFGNSDTFSRRSIELMDSVIKSDQNIRYVYGDDYSIEALRGLSIRSAVLWIRSQLHEERPIIAVNDNYNTFHFVSSDSKEATLQSNLRSQLIIDQAKFTYYNYNHEDVIKQYTKDKQIVIAFHEMMFGISHVRIILNILIPPDSNNNLQKSYTIHYEYEWGMEVAESDEIYFFNADEVSWILKEGHGINDIPQLINPPNWFLRDIVFYIN